MSTTEDQSTLVCPECNEPLYVRHTESGNVDRVRATHFVTSVTWQAECHSCQWQSPRRGTVWALIKVVTSGNSGNGDGTVQLRTDT